MVTEPTRERNILDLCLVSHTILVENVCVAETFSKSDHNVVSCNVMVDFRNFERPKKCCNFWHADWEGIHNHLTLVDWTELFDRCSLGTMWLKFRNLVDY